MSWNYRWLHLRFANTNEISASKIQDPCFGVFQTLLRIFSSKEPDYYRLLRHSTILRFSLHNWARILANIIESHLQHHREGPACSPLPYADNNRRFGFVFQVEQAMCMASENVICFSCQSVCLFLILAHITLSITQCWNRLFVIHFTCCC